MPTLKELGEYKRRLRQRPCANCGQPPGSPDKRMEIQADHVISPHRAAEFGLAEGDLELNPANFQPLCGQCNRFKETWTHDELRARRFVQWRQTAEVPNGEPVPYPRDFDWDTGEWVDQVLTDADQAYADQLLRGASVAEWLEYIESAPRVERRTLAEWVRGTLFDYPVRPGTK